MATGLTNLEARLTSARSARIEKGSVLNLHNKGNPFFAKSLGDLKQRSYFWWQQGLLLRTKLEIFPEGGSGNSLLLAR